MLLGLSWTKVSLPRHVGAPNRADDLVVPGSRHRGFVETETNYLQGCAIWTAHRLQSSWIVNSILMSAWIAGWIFTAELLVHHWMHSSRVNPARRTKKCRRATWFGQPQCNFELLE